MRGAAFAVAMSLLPMAAAAQETRPGPLMPVQPGSISGLLGGGGHQPDPRRVSHRLDLTIDANSGRDENVRAEYFGIPVDPANPLLSGAAGSAAAMMNYRWGREGRAIEANGLAYGTRFDGYNNWPMGAGALRALTNVGRRSGLAADVAFSYQPSFLQQTENPDSDVAVPPIADSEQQQGVTRQRWLASNASVEGFRNFTNRHRVELRVSGQRRNLLLGAGLESRQAAAQTQYRFTASRAIQLLASYQFSDLRQRETERTYEPLATHAAEIGASFTQRVSATRQAQFTVTAGAARGSRAASTDTPAADFAWTFAITSPPPPLVASFSSNSPVWAGQPVQFRNTSSGPAAAAYTWDFGDGGGATAAHPTHRYARPGRYTVTLTAAHGGTTARASAVVVVRARLVFAPLVVNGP